jgi:hypothetical protein
MSSLYPPSQPGPYGQYVQGQLVVNLSKPFGAFGLTPKITIDGFPAPARWEHNAYPVAPGRHQIQASVGSLWEYGAATQLVDIAPGQSVEVCYSSPMITLMAGRMGFEPQKRPGWSRSG